MEGKVVLITGGTGSFGSAFARRLLAHHNPKEVVIFSRDEDKQHRLRLELGDDRVRYEIGDVRDKDRLMDLMKHIDLVFHAAALKQVPSCEFSPLEAVKTNILGTENVLDAAMNRRVKKVVCLSTDKAVYPINAMGMSKAMMEKIAITKSKDSSLSVCVTRYGNVMASRGSVIPIWIDAAMKNLGITVTDPTMTRFLMSIEDAIDLVVYALENGANGDTFIKKAPASTMISLALAVRAICNSKSPIVEMGIRHGEKIHETLISQEEMLRTEDCGDYFRIAPDSRDMNYSKFFSMGSSPQNVKAYTSHNTKRLNQDQVEDLLQEIL